MVATKHKRSSAPTPRAGAWSPAVTSDTHAVERLIQQADGVRLRAPELGLVLGERAASLAETGGSHALWVHAEGLVVSARVRLGYRAGSVARGVAALRAAEDLGEMELAARLRTDLAVCARSVGVPLVGLAALRPVLGADGLAGADRAAALCQLVGCLSQFGRKPELDRAFVEADALCGADERLDGDRRLLARAYLRVGMSAHRRRHADILGAADAARTGLGLLEQLDDPGCDGGVVHARLILHLVCSLLDRGDAEHALEIAQPLLDTPARAAAIAPLGWLRLAVATRILLPAGGVEAAAVMLRDAVHSTERHGLHSLTSRLWMELSNVEQRIGRSSDAMECLHQSRAAEHVHARSRRQAVSLLSGEFGNGGHAAVDLDDVLGPVTNAVFVEDAPPQADVATRASDVPMASVPAYAAPSGASVTIGGGVVSAAQVSDLPSVGGEDRTAGLSSAETVTGGERGRSPGRDDKPLVPDLPLAPAPADAPAPRFTLVFEPKAPKTDPATGDTVQRAADGSAHVRTEPATSGSSDGPDEQTAADAEQPTNTCAAQTRSTQTRSTHPESDDKAGSRPAAGGVGRRADGGAKQGRTEQAADAALPKIKTRHDSEHGSVAARSVLDRLGISTGSGGGGRRRAADPEQAPLGSSAPGSERRPPVGEGVSLSAKHGSADASSEPETPGDGPEKASMHGASEAKKSLIARVTTASEPTNDTAPEVVTTGAGTTARFTNALEPEDPPGDGSDAEVTAGRAGTGASAGSAAAAGATATPIAGDSGMGSARHADDVDDGTATGVGAIAPSAIGDQAPSGVAATGAANGGGKTVGASADPTGDDADVTTEDSGADGGSATGDSGTDVVVSGTANGGHAAADESGEAAGDKSSGSGVGDGAGANEDWLPRLRLPPSLEPFEDFTDDALAVTSGTPFTSTPNIEDGGLGPFRADQGGNSFLDDELPENAGLADLLARALAEHRAGTSSAAALVKRLGNGGETKRQVNGHSGSGEAPGNGRHRTDG